MMLESIEKDEIFKMNPVPHYKNTSNYLAIEEPDRWTLFPKPALIVMETLNSSYKGQKLGYINTISVLCYQPVKLNKINEKLKS